MSKFEAECWHGPLSDSNPWREPMNTELMPGLSCRFGGTF